MTSWLRQSNLNCQSDPTETLLAIDCDESSEVATSEMRGDGRPFKRRYGVFGLYGRDMCRFVLKRRSHVSQPERKPSYRARPWVMLGEMLGNMHRYGLWDKL